ncbi:MAG: hypothetical protein AAF682_30850 [Planctomycetota bacterium]
MSPILAHILLFVALSAAIVVMGTFYSEPDDAVAFRAMPRRFGVFLVSCAVVAVVMLLAEHFFAAV